MSTWTEKVAATGVLGAILGPSATSSNIRAGGFPAAVVEPLRLCYDDAEAVGSLPTLPNGSYPSGAGVSLQGSGSLDGLYISDGSAWSRLQATNYAIVNKAKNSGSPAGSGDANIVGFVQDSVFRYPTIDTTSFPFPALRVDITAKSDARHGYLITSFKGYENTPHAAIGPHNGGEKYEQLKVRVENMAHNQFNGAFTELSKLIISAHTPDAALNFPGTESEMSSVFGYRTGYNSGKDALWASYNRNADGGYTVPFEETISGTLYVQTGALCPYDSGANYLDTRCRRIADDGWYTITRRFKLVPVGTDFQVTSGGHLTKTGAFADANFGNTGAGHAVGRRVYIVGDGYYPIASKQSNDSVTLTGSPNVGTGKTVYISDYLNSIIQEWVGSELITNLSDWAICWDSAYWGQFMLDPQQTGRNGSITATAGTVWYREVIMSTQPIALPTRFEALADACPVGSFALLDANGTSTNGFTESFLHGQSTLDVPPQNPSGGIWSFQSKLEYDSTTKRILGMGGPHANSLTPATTPAEDFAQYAITSDAWSRTVLADAVYTPAGAPNVDQGHSYDQNAIDVVNREGYYMLRTDGQVVRYDLDTLHTTPISQPSPTHGFGTGEGSLAYFPERGKLLRLRGDSLCEWTRATDMWVDVTDTAYISTTYIGDRAPIMLYSDVRGFVIFFGGTYSPDIDAFGAPNVTGFRRGVVKYDSAGAYSFLPSMPTSIQIYPQCAVHWIDPITGNLLLIAATQPSGFTHNWQGDIEFWELDLTPGAEVWNQLDDTVIPAVSGWWELPANNPGTGPSGVISVAVPEYGVAVLASGEVSGLNEKAYIYRHGEGANLLPGGGGGPTDMLALVLR